MGSKSDLRQQGVAIRAYRLREQGLKTNEIAKLIDRKPEQIKALVLLGERIISRNTPE